ncbi:hypothetical protein WMF20_31900 [Sorangium sp. So ce834]|uniref:hypothetical protein n=1 Tax=Sorangium sp. So ce834 TaxID=3133321 RepID=UPI003F5EAA8C
MITILDACCAINLYHGGALAHVLELGARVWTIGPRVLEECADDCGDALRDAVTVGRVMVLDDEEISASLYLSILATHGLGDGETECITVASLNATTCIATDDGRARSIAISLFGKKRVTGSLGLLRECVQAGILQTHEAYAAYVLMIQAGGFLPNVREVFFIPSGL